MKTAQRSFAYGEVAPALYARPDLAMYSQALRTLRNAYVMRAGGVQSRPGTMKGITTRSQGTIRLVPCVFSDSENFMLEFGDEYVRVLKNGGPHRVPSSGNWADETEYALGVIVSEQDITNATRHFLCIQAHESVEADDQPIFGTDWEDYWYPLDGDATTPPAVVWPTPYTHTQLSALRFAQTPGTITIVHPEHAPAQLTRVASNQWALADINFAAPAGVLAPENFVGTIDDTGIASWSNGQSYPLNRLIKRTDVIYRCIQSHTSSATNAPGTGADWEDYWAIKGTGGDDGGFWYVVTAVDADGNESPASTPVKMDSSQNPLSPTWRNVLFTWDVVVDAVQYYVYRSQSSEFGYRRILSVAPGGYAADTNPLNTAYISTDGPPVQNFFFDQAGEYPSTVSFYQQRLLFAASTDSPDTVWASVTGKPFDFNVRFPIQDDDAISWRQLSRQSVEIRHLVEIGRRLVAFTNVGEYIVTGADDGVLRPGEVNPTLYSYNGANGLEPIVIDNTALYVQARGSRVLRISPEYQDEPAGSDLSLLATHLLEGYEIVSWAYQEVPNSLVWMVRNDGALLCLSYVREAGITAWSKCDTNGFVKSVCCVPEGGEDAVYIVVIRNGLQYIERMTDRLASDPIGMDATVDVSIGGPSDIAPDSSGLPQDPGYRYANIFLPAGFGFESDDIGAWIQLFMDNTAWVAWEITGIKAEGGTGEGDAPLVVYAQIRSPLANTPSNLTGTFSDASWVYRRASASPDHIVLPDDPDAPIPESLEIHDFNYDSDTELTTATVTSAGPVFLPSSVGSRIALKADNEWTSWPVDTVLSPMVATLKKTGEFDDFSGVYAREDWTYQPSGLEHLQGLPYRIIVDDELLPVSGIESISADGAEIVDVQVYSVGSQYYGQGEIRLQYGLLESDIVEGGDDVFNNWEPGIQGAITNTPSFVSTSQIVNGVKYVLVPNNYETGQFVVAPEGKAGFISYYRGQAIRMQSDGSLGPLDSSVSSTTYPNWPVYFSYDPENPFNPIQSPTPKYGKRRYWAVSLATGFKVSSVWLVDSDGYRYLAYRFNEDNDVGIGGGLPEGGPFYNIEPTFDVVQYLTDNPRTLAVSEYWNGLPIYRPYKKLRIGLPYNVDIETLDLDSPRQSIKNDPVRMGEVFVWLDRSGSFYVGPKATDDTSELELYTPMNDEGYALPEGELYTGVAPVTLRTTYTRNGRIFIRQPDPKPLTVTAIIADGLINGRG